MNKLYQVYRKARKMKNEDIESNKYRTADTVGMGSKTSQYTIFQYSEHCVRVTDPDPDLFC